MHLPGMGVGANCCEHGNELSGSKSCSKCTDQLNNYSSSKRYSALVEALRYKPDVAGLIPDVVFEI
jgi:hypothetical protein